MNKHWTQEQERFLVANYKELTFQEIAEELGFSSSSVGHKASRMGLYKHDKNRFADRTSSKNDSKEWLPWEDKRIEKYHGIKSHVELAKMLDVSVQQLTYRKRQLGLNQPRDRWTKKEDAYLRKHYLKSPLAVIMKKLGRSKLGVVRRAQYIGLNNITKAK